MLIAGALSKKTAPALPSEQSESSGVSRSTLPTNIPKGWRVVRLTDLAKLESGHTPSRRNPNYWNGDIPWVSLHDSDDLDSREISVTNRNITLQGVQNSSARILPKGTVVFSRTATVGKATVLGRDMTTSQDFACYVCGPEVHNHYLVYLFRYMAPEWKRLMAGSTHNTVYMPVFRSLKVVLPPIHEQIAIAKSLHDIDDSISGYASMIDKKLRIKGAVAQELLSGRRRLPGFTNAWEKTTLGALSRIQRGASPRPIDDPVWFDNSSPVGWVRISDVTSSGMYLCDTTQRLSQAGVRKSRPVSRGSLIMSICATVGRPIITSIDVCIHDGFVVFDAIKGSRDFLYYLLQSLEDGWARKGQTGSQMNLNTSLIEKTEVSLPSDFLEQEEIASVLRDHDEDILQSMILLEKTRQTKQGMMEQLLTGKVRLA